MIWINTTTPRLWFGNARWAALQRPGLCLAVLRIQWQNAPRDIHLPGGRAPAHRRRSIPTRLFRAHVTQTFSGIENT